MSRFDICIIGAGPGGYSAAFRAAHCGKTVALVESRRRPGGTCLHIGCIPSKALLEASEFYRDMVEGRARTFGLSCDNPRFDLAAVHARKNQVVGELAEGLSLGLKKAGVVTFSGHGRLLPDRTVQVTAEDGKVELIHADNVILAAGSEACSLPGIVMDGKRIVSSTEALAFDQVPESLIVLGAGAVGLELASVWLRLGASVQVVELADEVAPFADRQAARELRKHLRRQGMEFLLSTAALTASAGRDGVTLTVRNRKGLEETLSASVLLVSVGRKPASAGLGLEEAGVKSDGRGRVEVDECLRTSMPGVFAIGDLVKGPMLAHKAEAEGKFVAALISGAETAAPACPIPSVVYTFPELAQVGSTEEELAAAGQRYRTGVFSFLASGRAKAMDADLGFVKVLGDEAGKLLGVHIVGPHASELIAESVLAVRSGMTWLDVVNTVHSHPTLSEAFREAAEQLGRAK